VTQCVPGAEVDAGLKDQSRVVGGAAGLRARPRLSVIVCTHNRAAKLEQTLHAVISCVRVLEGEVEFVVVDNNSTDATQEVIAGFSSRCNVPVHYVFERSQGLSYARNAGLSRARGRIVAFTDDDCVPAAEWALTVVDQIEAIGTACVIGGRVELFDSADCAVTVRLSRKRALMKAAGDAFSFIAGCNMAFPRETSERIGLFDVRLGAGSPGRSAEDVDFQYRAWRAGLTVVYEPSILVYHDHGRRTPESVRRLHADYSFGRGAIYAKHCLRGDRAMIRSAVWDLRALIGDAFRVSDRGVSSVARRQLVGIVKGALYMVKCVLVGRTGA